MSGKFRKPIASRLRHRWRQVRNLVVRGGPTLIFLVYLALIVAFGAGYRALPAGSFYAPYAQNEPAGRNDRERLEQAIERSLQNHLLNAPASSGAWLVDPHSVRVSSLRADGDDVVFDVALYATGQIAGKTIAVSGPYRFSMPLQGRMFEFPSKIGPCRLITLVSKDASGLASKVTQALFRADRPCTNLPALTLTWREDNQLTALHGGVEADPSLISGWLGRSMYLSATTITTTGYGDIVPLTPLARFMTGLEAILGWIVSGIFIAVLAAQAPWRVIKAEDEGGQAPQAPKDFGAPPPPGG